MSQAGTQSLSALKKRKAALEEDLKQVEKQIYDLEEKYLEETNHYGNVVKGWEGFLNCKPKAPHTIRKPKISDKDRLFSYSSVTPLPQQPEGGEEME